MIQSLEGMDLTDRIREMSGRIAKRLNSIKTLCADPAIPRKNLNPQHPTTFSLFTTRRPERRSVRLINVCERTAKMEILAKKIWIGALRSKREHFYIPPSELLPSPDTGPRDYGTLVPSHHRGGLQSCLTRACSQACVS